MLSTSQKKVYSNTHTNPIHTLLSNRIQLIIVPAFDAFQKPDAHYTNIINFPDFRQNFRRFLAGAPPRRRLSTSPASYVDNPPYFFLDK
jgi:hypothetical protein